MSLDDRPLYYLHIPKTAGTTLINLLDQHFTDSEIYPEHDYADGLERGLSPDARAGYRFYRGHFPYPIAYPAIGKPMTITVLRDPRKRLMSNFEMRRRVDDPRERLRTRLHEMTLSQFLDDPEMMFRFGNYSTKLLGGFYRDDRGLFQPNAEAAMENLEAMDIVGITERFDDSVDLVLAGLGLPAVERVGRANVSPAESRVRDELTDAEWDRVADAEQLDIALHTRAVELFERAWAGHAATDSRRFFDATNGLELDMRRIDPGHGWYPGEAHGVLGVIRWTGPGTTAAVHLIIHEQQQYEVTVSTVGWGAGDAEMTITANGASLPSRVRSYRDTVTAVSATVPPQGLSDLVLGLELSAVGTKPPDLRPLGVCVAHIGVRPLGE